MFKSKNDPAGVKEIQTHKPCHILSNTSKLKAKIEVDDEHYPDKPAKKTIKKDNNLEDAAIDSNTEKSQKMNLNLEILTEKNLDYSLLGARSKTGHFQRKSDTDRNKLLMPILKKSVLGTMILC